MAHLEMVGTMVHQLTDGASPREMEEAGLGAYILNQPEEFRGLQLLLQ